MNKIIVLGSINMDLVFKVEQIPKIGETIRGKGLFMAPGGKGANQAVACARQEIKTYLIGSIGGDELSKTCKQSLLKYGVDCTYISELTDQRCGVAGIFLESNNNRIITDQGANKFQNIDSIIDILDNISEKNDILVSQLEIPVDVIEAAFKKAKERNMITILNVAPVMQLSDNLLALIDILVVNETEMEIISGQTINNLEQIQDSAKGLLSRGVKSVLLTLGENGSIYIDSIGNIKVDAFNTNVVDTTAAGDTYIGAFAAQLIEGISIEKAMIYASAAASLSIKKQGAQISIPTKSETQEFMISQEEN